MYSIKCFLYANVFLYANENLIVFCIFLLQVGFNRGARNEKLTWEYGGGDTFTFWIEPKDFEEAEENKPMGFYMDGKKPSVPIKDMELVRICVMPKSNEALSKAKRTCFAFKGLGPCTRTLVSYLPILQKTMPKTLTEAIEKAQKTMREGKVEWAHHLSMISGTVGDFSNCDPRTVSFLETKVDGQSTFIYQTPTASEGNDMVRMCIKASNNSGVKYHIDMPVHNVLRYTNANTLEDAVGLLNLAASADALNVFVMHNPYWENVTTSVSSLGGKTAFRGVPIIDQAKLVAPIMSETFLSKKYEVVGEGRKAKVVGIHMGFKVFVSEGGEDDEEMTGVMGNGASTMVPKDMYVDISLNTRSVQQQRRGLLCKDAKKAYEFRLAPHGHMDMETCHVMSFYIKESEDKNRTIMNLDFNASHEIVGGSCDMGGRESGKKHTWHTAVPSAIDEDDEEEEEKENVEKSESTKVVATLENEDGGSDNGSGDKAGEMGEMGGGESKKKKAKKSKKNNDDQ